jgi:hypothetical protein
LPHSLSDFIVVATTSPTLLSGGRLDAYSIQEIADLDSISLATPQFERHHLQALARFLPNLRHLELQPNTPKQPASPETVFDWDIGMININLPWHLFTKLRSLRVCQATAVNGVGDRPEQFVLSLPTSLNSISLPCTYGGAPTYDPLIVGLALDDAKLPNLARVHLVADQGDDEKGYFRDWLLDQYATQLDSLTVDIYSTTAAATYQCTRHQYSLIDDVMVSDRPRSWSWSGAEQPATLRDDRVFLGL